MQRVRIAAMSLVRAGFYGGLGTAARLLVSLVVIKLVASLVGPEGVGKLGQFLSLMSVLAVFAGGGINTGIVKYAAEYRRDPERLARLLSAALWYISCACLVMGALTLVLSPSIAGWLLGDVQYASLIRILAFAQFGVALLNYLLAVINGFMDVKRLAFIQVLGAAFSVLMAAWLSWQLHLYGAMLALILGQVMSLIVGLPTFSRSPYFRSSMFVPRFDPDMTRRLSAFSVMTLASVLCPQLVNIAVRNHLVAQFGWGQVGEWQAVGKVSDAYLLFLTTAINVYYLPKLAETRESAALISELRNAYRYILPAAIALAALAYSARQWLTPLLFSNEFDRANSLYAPQLIGDVIKIASFVLSYLMLAKSMTQLFVISEIAFALSYLILVYLFTAQFGLIGAIYAFTANYVLYLVFNVLVARRYLGTSW
jgi:polysaccharide transporter, PST family